MGLSTSVHDRPEGIIINVGERVMTKFMVDLTDDNNETVTVLFEGLKDPIEFDLRSAAHLAAELAVGVALKVEQSTSIVTPNGGGGGVTAEPPAMEGELKWRRMGNGSSNYMALTPGGAKARVFKHGTGWFAELDGKVINEDAPLLLKRDAQILVNGVVFTSA